MFYYDDHEGRWLPVVLDPLVTPQPKDDGCCVVPSSKRKKVRGKENKPQKSQIDGYSNFSNKGKPNDANVSSKQPRSSKQEQRRVANLHSLSYLSCELNLSGCKRLCLCMFLVGLPSWAVT